MLSGSVQIRETKEFRCEQKLGVSHFQIRTSKGFPCNQNKVAQKILSDKINLQNLKMPDIKPANSIIDRKAKSLNVRKISSNSNEDIENRPPNGKKIPDELETKTSLPLTQPHVSINILKNFNITKVASYTPSGTPLTQVLESVNASEDPDATVSMIIEDPDATISMTFEDPDATIPMGLEETLLKFEDSSLESLFVSVRVPLKTIRSNISSTFGDKALSNKTPLGPSFPPNKKRRLEESANDVSKKDEDWISQYINAVVDKREVEFIEKLRKEDSKGQEKSNSTENTQEQQQLISAEECPRVPSGNACFSESNENGFGDPLFKVNESDEIFHMGRMLLTQDDYRNELMRLMQNRFDVNESELKEVADSCLANGWDLALPVECLHFCRKIAEGLYEPKCSKDVERNCSFEEGSSFDDYDDSSFDEIFDYFEDKEQWPQFFEGLER